jgi:hypothetical protein
MIAERGLNPHPDPLRGASERLTGLRNGTAGALRGHLTNRLLLLWGADALHAHVRGVPHKSPHNQSSKGQKIAQVPVGDILVIPTDDLTFDKL